MAKQVLKRTEILANGKVNLSLDVTGTEPNGYHSLRMIMRTLPFGDTVTVSSEIRGGTMPKNVSLPERLPINVACDSKAVPAGLRNIAWRAAEALIRRYPRILACSDSVNISIRKVLPVGGGLGGSSADGAAVLKAMNSHFELGLSDGELEEIGIRLGSDVPFLIRGGTALAEGRGEILTELPEPDLGFMLICFPGYGMDTWEVYRRYDEMHIPEGARPDTDALQKSLLEGRRSDFVAGMRNVLEVPAFALKTALSGLKTQIERLGGENTVMCGSGSSFFTIFRTESAARRAAQQLEYDGCECTVCDMRAAKAE